MIAAADLPAPSMASAALDLARLGWRILPLHGIVHGHCTCGRPECGKSAGKHPRILTGAEHAGAATVDREIIRSWWNKWPDANLGVMTGPISGVVVLDVDGERGLETLAQLVAAIGPLPPTVTSRTGSGGLHYLFAHPGADHRVCNRAHALGTPGPDGRTGLDIRGNGGLFVLPPSLHYSGQRYEWIASPETTALAPWDWLGRAHAYTEELRQRSAPPSAAPRNVLPLRQGQATVMRRAAAYLARLSPSISGAGGHSAAWTAALALTRGFELPVEDALALLISDFNPRCDPQWSERELRHKVESAAAKADVPPGFLLDAPLPERAAPAQRRVLPDPPAWMDEIPPPDDAPDEIGSLLGFLPETQPVARWVGWQAARAGRAAELRGQIPETLLAEYDAGAALPEGARISRPPGTSEAQVKRLRRRLAASPPATPPDQADAPALTIVRLVRQAVAGRARFSLTLALGEAQATLTRLVGADLGSYKAIRDLAIESRMVLPAPTTKVRRAWDEALAAAMATVVEEAPEIEEAPVLAIREEILAILMAAEVGDTEADLYRGLVLRDEAATQVYMVPRVLVSRVRARLAEDRPDREQIVDAARLLGATPQRPLIHGARPRVWSFPTEMLDRAKRES